MSKKKDRKRRKLLRELIAGQKADRRRDIALTRTRSVTTKTTRYVDDFGRKVE